MTTPEVPLGAKVQVSAGVGYVKWTGANPKFSAGKWVGVELLEPTGKNDGSVQGIHYFESKPQHGVFVRPSQVKVLEAPKPTPRPGVARTATATPTSRMASSTTTRTSTPQRPPNAAAGPSTPPRPSLASKQSSPSKLSSRQVSSSSIASATRPPSSIGQPIRPPSAAAAAPGPISRAPTPQEIRRVSSPTSHVPPPSSPARSEVSQAEAARPVPMRSMSSAMAASHAMPPPPAPIRPGSPTKRAATPDAESSTAIFAQKRELDELRIKVRILENRRTEDQERIKVMEARAAEADTLRAARVKLQAKFQELQTSVAAAQRSSRDLQSENAHLDARATEANDQLEMAALDREVAEERAEAAEAEVEKLNEKIAELELEVAVLKEENAEYDKPVSGAEGERTSLAYIQLEKHNERLKEALIRLRDISTENDKESKAKVADLEKELSSYGDAQSRLELSEAKLANAEAQVEDLKLQLDDALGAEDLLEQLTERNLVLSERIEEMRQTIEDLEALKDLNDELEENHVEAEKQLNSEIDLLSSQLRQERQKLSESDTMILETETTISQFRDLVASLQSEVETLRVQQASQEFESATTSKEAQAIMNMNLKLQSTAVKTQNKTIDIELKKLEASQLAEHLRIVQAYLPDPYLESEADSTALYLTFLRLYAKVDILVSTVSQSHGLPSALHADNPGAPPLVGACELKGKLRDFSNLAKRFSAVMTRCQADQWTTFGKILTEIGGVEARVDGWISSIKLDEFNEKDCAGQLASLTAQFDHLAATSFARPDLDVPEQQLALAYTVDDDLDNFAAAVGFARQAVFALAQEPDIQVEVGDSSLDEGIYAPVQRILDQVRAVKTPSSKLVAQIQDSAVASVALLPEVTAALSDLSHSVSSAVDLAVQLAQRIGAHTAALRVSKEPLRLSDIEGFLIDITATSAAPSEMAPWDQIGMFISRLGAELGSVLPRIRTAAKDGQVVSMDIPPPWLARVAAIKEAATHNVDTERKVIRMSEELKDLLREVKIRDQTLQESGVKVETLERRLEATRKQADQIIELENDVAKAKKQEKVYSDAIEQLQAEQDALEAENVKLRKGQGVDPKGSGFASTAALGESVLLPGAGLESSQLAEQVENLRSTVRFLRSENALLKSRHVYPDLSLLKPLPAYSPPRARDTATEVPPLSPSSPSSPTSDSASPLTPTTPPTRHSIETESKLLSRDITNYQIKPRIIDISNIQHTSQWRSRKHHPDMQIIGWRKEEARLSRRLESLKDRMRSIQLP